MRGTEWRLIHELVWAVLIPDHCLVCQYDVVCKRVDVSRRVWRWWVLVKVKVKRRSAKRWTDDEGRLVAVLPRLALVDGREMIGCLSCRGLGVTSH